MKIGILGLGSLGTLMAYHNRTQTVFALPKDSRTLHLARLSHQGQLWQANLPRWQGDNLDWLIVSVKAAQTQDALNAWRTFLPQVRHLLLLQNGMGQQEQVAAFLKQHRLPCTLWAAMSTEGAFRTGEQVVYAGEGRTWVGLWPKGVSSCTLPSHCEAEPQIERALRKKLAINAVINPLTGFYRCKNGELLSQPSHHQALLALCQEIAELYRRLGWTLDKPLTELVEQVAKNTAANTSSTLQDIQAKRPTELPYICGYLLKQAQALHHTLPITQRLYQALSQTSTTRP